MGQPLPKRAYAAVVSRRGDVVRALSRPLVAGRRSGAAGGFGRGSSALPGLAGRSRRGSEDAESSCLGAFVLLPLPRALRGRAAAADRGPQSGARAVHRPRLLRSAGRNAGIAGGASAPVPESADGRFGAVV